MYDDTVTLHLPFAPLSEGTLWLCGCCTTCGEGGDGVEPWGGRLGNAQTRALSRHRAPRLYRRQ